MHFVFLIEHWPQTDYSVLSASCLEEMEVNRFVVLQMAYHQLLFSLLACLVLFLQDTNKGECVSIGYCRYSHISRHYFDTFSL